MISGQWLGVSFQPKEGGGVFDWLSLCPAFEVSVGPYLQAFGEIFFEYGQNVGDFVQLFCKGSSASSRPHERLVRCIFLVFFWTNQQNQIRL